MGCTFHPKILGSPIMTGNSFSNRSNSLQGTMNYNNNHKGSYDSQQNNPIYNLPTNSCEPPDLDMNNLANQVVRQMFNGGNQQLTPQYTNEYGNANTIGNPQV